MEGLRVSHVAPRVEDDLLQLNELVKKMGNRGCDLTESQNRRMVAYLGNVDEMRQQLVIMVQRYEDDERVLKRLLDLVDRIDDVKSILEANNVGSESEGSDGADANLDDELARHLFDQPHNPLMVSQKEVSLLAVSGLADDGAYAASLAYLDEHADEDEANPWDQDDDPELLAASIEFEEPNLDLEPLDIKLTVSSIGLPTVMHPLPGEDGVPPPPPLPPHRGAAYRRHTTAGSASSSSSRGNQRRRRQATINHPLASSDSESDTYTGSSSSSEEEGPVMIGRRGRRRVQIQNDARYQPAPPPPPPAAPEAKGKRRLYGARPEVNCAICFDSFATHEAVYEFDECKHTYCRECLKGYLDVHISEGAVLDLGCPCPGCTTEVDIEDVRFLCDYETVAKYERFVVIASLKADANTRWCPAPNCVNAVKVDPSSPWLFCSLCGFNFCSTCLSEKHEGSECSKAVLATLAARQEQEEKALESFQKWADEHQSRVKPCPLCHTFIEKTEGCNHMTCGNIACHYQFCWLCLGSYDNGLHFNDFTNNPNCFDKQFYTPSSEYYDASTYVYNGGHYQRRRLGRLARKIGIYVGVGMAVVTLGVPAAVIGGPVYGCFQLHKRLKAKRERRGRYVPDPNFIPPTPQRIAEARREVERLRALEREIR